MAGLASTHAFPAVLESNHVPLHSHPQTNIIVYLTAIMNESNSSASSEVGPEVVEGGGEDGACAWLLGQTCARLGLAGAWSMRTARRCRRHAF